MNKTKLYLFITAAAFLFVLIGCAVSTSGTNKSATPVYTPTTQTAKPTVTPTVSPTYTITPTDTVTPTPSPQIINIDVVSLFQDKWSTRYGDFTIYPAARIGVSRDGFEEYSEKVESTVINYIKTLENGDTPVINIPINIVVVGLEKNNSKTKISYKSLFLWKDTNQNLTITNSTITWDGQGIIYTIITGNEQIALGWEGFLKSQKKAENITLVRINRNDQGEIILGKEKDSLTQLIGEDANVISSKYASSLSRSSDPIRGGVWGLNISDGVLVYIYMIE